MQHNGQEKTPQKMPSFRDGSDREWRIHLTGGIIDAVVMETGIDLIPDNCDVSGLTGLLFDYRKLTSVLWCCIEVPAEKKGVTKDDFAYGLDGECLSDGWNALVEAVLFFIRSQSPAMAGALEEAIETAMKFVQRGAESLIKTMRSEETDKMIQQSIDEAGKSLHEGFAKALAGSAMN